MRRIITVGREFGSGGRELGRRIAEELQIAYYDQEIIKENFDLMANTSGTDIRKMSESLCSYIRAY